MLKIVKNSKKFVLTEKAIATLTRLMAKFSGKELAINTMSDTDFKDLIELLRSFLVASRPTASYITSVMYAISEGYDADWSKAHGSVNNFHENVGAGKASAHYTRLSTTERALEATLKAEKEADDSFAFYVAPVVRMIKFLLNTGTDLFESIGTDEADDYAMIWNYAVLSGLTIGKATKRLWYDTEYLADAYEFEGLEDEDTVDLPKLTPNMMFSKMMKYAKKHSDAVIKFPKWTWTDIRSLAEIRETKPDCSISKTFAEATLNHAVDYGVAQNDIEYYGINDVAQLNDEYFALLDSDDENAKASVKNVEEMFKVFTSWRNVEFLTTMLDHAYRIDSVRSLDEFRKSNYYKTRKLDDMRLSYTVTINLGGFRTEVI